MWGGCMFREKIMLLYLKKIGESFQNEYNKIVKIWENNTIESFVQEQLIALLKHAYHNVPYYKRLLKETGIVYGDGKIDIDRFKNLPYLTKEHIRNHFKAVSYTHLTLPTKA